MLACMHASNQASERASEQENKQRQVFRRSLFGFGKLRSTARVSLSPCPPNPSSWPARLRWGWGFMLVSLQPRSTKAKSLRLITGVFFFLTGHPGKFEPFKMFSPSNTLPKRALSLDEQLSFGYFWWGDSQLQNDHQVPHDQRMEGEGLLELAKVPAMSLVSKFGR